MIIWIRKEKDVDTIEGLAKVKLFEHLDHDGLARLASQMQSMSFAHGPIIGENDASDGLYIITSGMVRVTKRSDASQSEAVLDILRPGDTFGELGLIDGLPRSANVSAMGPLECYFLSRDAFQEALKSHPEIALALLPALTSMIRSADRWLGGLI